MTTNSNPRSTRGQASVRKFEVVGLLAVLIFAFCCVVIGGYQRGVMPGMLIAGLAGAGVTAGAVIARFSHLAWLGASRTPQSVPPEYERADAAGHRVVAAFGAKCTCCDRAIDEVLLLPMYIKSTPKTFSGVFYICPLDNCRAILNVGVDPFHLQNDIVNRINARHVAKLDNA